MRDSPGNTRQGYHGEGGWLEICRLANVGTRVIPGDSISSAWQSFRAPINGRHSRALPLAQPWGARLPEAALLSLGSPRSEDRRDTFSPRRPPAILLHQ